MLGDKIKAGRHEKGLSQQEFAQKLSVVRQTVSKWEKGLSLPDSDMLIKIAEVLGTSVSSLLEEEKPEGNIVTPSKEDAVRRVGVLEIVLLVLGSPLWISLLIVAISIIRLCQLWLWLYNRRINYRNNAKHCFGNRTFWCRVITARTVDFHLFGSFSGNKGSNMALKTAFYSYKKVH